MSMHTWDNRYVNSFNRFGGMKFIVMDSSLLRHPERFAHQIKQQEGVLLHLKYL